MKRPKRDARKAVDRAARSADPVVETPEATTMTDRLTFDAVVGLLRPRIAGVVQASIDDGEAIEGFGVLVFDARAVTALALGDVCEVVDGYALSTFPREHLCTIAQEQRFSRWQVFDGQGKPDAVDILLMIEGRIGAGCLHKGRAPAGVRPLAVHAGRPS